MEHQGSLYCYNRGCRQDRCREAKRQANKASQARAVERGRADPRLIPHGTSTGQGYWGCRCPLCREANTRAQADLRARRKR